MAKNTMRVSAKVLTHPTSGDWFLSTRVHPQILGWLPDFLKLDDPRPAKEQITERYRFGWNDMKPIGAEFDFEEGGLKFPGDPEMRPLAVCHFREELVILFPHDIIVIVQPDKSWEIARID